MASLVTQLELVRELRGVHTGVYHYRGNADTHQGGKEEEKGPGSAAGLL